MSLCESSNLVNFSFRGFAEEVISERMGFAGYSLDPKLRDRKGTPKNLCDKDFAELSGELSRAICLKALVLLGNDR